MSEDKKAKDGGKGSSRRVAKKKHYGTIAFGKVYINSSFNNTLVTITNERGNVLCWSTSGSNGFRGSKKGTPFAAQITASKVAAKAMEYGVRQAHILVNGPGPGRETAIRAIAQAGIHVMSIKDVTSIPHNGCRPPKPRRV